MKWYVKVAVFGVVAPDATTWHKTREGCLAYIAKQLVSGTHNLQYTTFFYGEDGQKGTEVSVTEKK